MKKIKLIKYGLLFLILLGVSLSVYAVDKHQIGDGELGYGIYQGGSKFIDLPLDLGGDVYGSTTGLYFMTPYAGEYVFDLYATSNSNIALKCLNYSGGVYTWVSTSGCFNGGVTDLNVSSNVGVCIISHSGCDGFESTHIDWSIDDSNISNVVRKDYTYRNFTGGVSYQIPVLNLYRPSETAVWKGSGLSYDVLTANNVSGLLWVTWSPSCDIVTGENPFIVINSNSSKLEDSQSYGYFSMGNAVVPLNLTYSSPTIQPNYTFDLNSVINFSIVVNTPEAVGDVVWYVDGGVVSSGDNFSFSYLFSSEGQHTVTGRAINWNCFTWVDTNWSFNVGKSVSLIGTVYGPFGVLEGVTVSLNKSGFFQSVPSLVDGSYSFSNLVPGTYTVSFSKSGYVSSSGVYSLNYSSWNPSVYRLDVTLSVVVGGGSLLVVVNDDSYLPLSDFYMDLFNGGDLVLSVRNASITVSKYGISAVVSSNSVSVSEVPLGYYYEIDVWKPGYVDKVSSLSVSKAYANLSFSNTFEFFNFYLKSGGSQNISSVGDDLFVSFPSSVSVGDVAVVSASYTFNGVPMSGASCVYESSAVYPSNGSLLPEGSSYSASVEILNYVGSKEITVMCQLVGHENLALTADFTVYAGDAGGTSVSWVLFPSRVNVSDSTLIKVEFVDSMSSGIVAGKCSLNMNGTISLMGEVGNGYYSFIFSTSRQGVYSYYVNCSKVNYSSSSSSIKSLAVGNIVAPPVSHCINGRKDPTESDVDCGGVDCVACGVNLRCRYNSDCLGGFCLSQVCKSPSCSDGIMDGDESGVDCGGSCNMQGKYCACGTNWDCSDAGDETCIAANESLLGECIKTNCSSSCDSIWWSTPEAGYFLRPRYCYQGACYFQNMNSSGAAPSLIIAPLTSFVFNDSGVVYYVSNCEEGTNGLKVVSTYQTLKYYSFSGISKSPSVPASSIVPFSSSYSTSVIQTFSSLCEIPASNELIYGLVTVQVHEQGGLSQAASAYMLNFRSRFKVNASFIKSGGNDALLLNSTRNMTCQYHTVNSAWANVSGFSNHLVIENISVGLGFYIYCNSSYGESLSLYYGKGGKAHALIVLIVDDILVPFFGGMFETIVGDEFHWQPEFIVPVAFFVLIGLPILIVAGYFAISRRYQNKPGA